MSTVKTNRWVFFFKLQSGDDKSKDCNEEKKNYHGIALFFLKISSKATAGTQKSPLSVFVSISNQW